MHVSRIKRRRAVEIAGETYEARLRGLDQAAGYP
jgi:hypothetical protein